MKNFGGGLQQLMRQANQMQAKVKKAQEDIALKEFEAASGGGAVTIKMNGQYKMLSCTIKKDVFEAGDIEMLQDLILTATNEAIKTVKEISDKEMEKITGGFPGLGGMF